MFHASAVITQRLKWKQPAGNGSAWKPMDHARSPKFSMTFSQWKVRVAESAAALMIRAGAEFGLSPRRWWI